jgi:hypothetical protein
LISSSKRRAKKKKSKKGRKISQKTFQNFLQIPASKISSPVVAVAFWLLPSPTFPPLSSLTLPPLCFKDLPEGLGFLAWNGIVTLWTSAPTKGGVYGEAVYFFLAGDDLQQRE